LCCLLRLQHRQAAAGSRLGGQAAAAGAAVEVDRGGQPPEAAGLLQLQGRWGSRSQAA
jgi:hypothetical protein